VVNGVPDADARLREQYEVERELAERLRSATKAERRGLYREVYDELFRRLADHPRLRRAVDRQARDREVALQANLLRAFLDEGTRFLEVGAGDCALALAISRRVAHVTAVDASAEVTAGVEPSANLELVVADGPPLPEPDGSVDLAYSCHFIEHLHPQDAADHVADIHRILGPGGRYVCVTPNRLLGPHDVSRSFDDVATGLHLKEYSHTELARLLRGAGFARVRVLSGIGGRPRPVGLLRYRVAETALEALPRRRRLRLLTLIRPAAAEPFRPLEQVVVTGTR
jgi:SAM-dependent methyltransferase